MDPSVKSESRDTVQIKPPCAAENLIKLSEKFTSGTKPDPDLVLLHDMKWLVSNPDIGDEVMLMEGDSQAIDPNVTCGELMIVESSDGS